MEQPSTPTLPPALMREAIEFVLVRPSHPGNIGAAARAIATMGFARLCVVAPRFDDALDRVEARAFASGATDILAATRVVPDLTTAIGQAHWVVGFSAELREFAAPALGPRAMAAEVMNRLAEEPGVAADQPAPVAIIFGTERTGLSITEAQRCQRLCQIDTDPGHTSLNLAQAVQLAAFVLREAALLGGARRPAGEAGAALADAAVAGPAVAGDSMAEAAMAGDSIADTAMAGDSIADTAIADTAMADTAMADTAMAGTAMAGGAWPRSGAAGIGVREPGDRAANQQQLEGMFGHLETMLVAIGFLDPQRPKRLMPRLRNLFSRARLSVTEVDILRGICTRILEGWRGLR
ncbi:MAG: TrmH family RNA methyltransferase [Burkholderiaceae bacterium]